MNYSARLVSAAAATVVAAGLALAQDALNGDQPSYRPETPLGLDEYYPVPSFNPLTKEKVELGRRLFGERLLSIDSSTACASCHRPDATFADTVPISTGARGRRPLRHTPSLLNRAYGRVFFWDGRARSLEETVLQPIAGRRELQLPIRAMVERLEADSAYRARFERVFEDGVTATNVARALASYIRTLRSGGSPFDRYVNGDRSALTAEQRAGLRLFTGKANCTACHGGPNLTDEAIHNTGVSWGGPDIGRMAVTGDAAERGRFKTPTLRNVARTAPYMHDGSRATLRDVVEFYDGGGTSNPNLDPEIQPLQLSETQKEQLLAFLEALTGE